MNIKLVRYTVWTRVLLTGFLAWGILLWRTENRNYRFKSTYPWISKAMLAVFFGAAVAFLTNDSGVVATATVLIFGLQAPLFLALSGFSSGTKSRD